MGHDHSDRQFGLRARLSLSAPYFGVALVYFVARFTILGRFQGGIQPEWTLGTLLTSMPSVIAFYLRQIVWPHPVSPSYPIRMLRLSEASIVNFLLPLLVAVLVLLIVWRLAKHEPVARVGLALAVTSLLPALNLRGYVIDQLVHDRYLYLPVLGALMVTVPVSWKCVQRFVKNHATRVLMSGALVSVAVALSISQTRGYSAAWSRELALWQWAVTVDPNSAFTQLNLAAQLQQTGRLEEARIAISRSLAILPTSYALIQRGQISYAEGHYEEAIRDFTTVIEGSSASLSVYEQLSAGLQAANRLDEAVVTLRQARDAHPYLKCRTTANLVITLFKAGRASEILPELESVRSHASQEYGLESRRVLLMLGQRYAELGRFPEARAVLDDFLQLTRDMTGGDVDAARTRAQAMLRAFPQ